MVWSEAAKTLGVCEPVGYASILPLVRDSPRLKRASIEVTPAKLFGAIARCSHLYPVAASAVTHEACFARALVEHQVEEASVSFALKPSAAKFKDFVRSHFTGSVAAGLTYMFLEQLGYAWVDHFEQHTPPDHPPRSPAPDFLFSVPGAGDIALVEAKGTQTKSPAALYRTLQAAYHGQVEPHLGKTFSGSCASHGFAVGAWLNPPGNDARARRHPSACLQVHQTLEAVVTGDARPRLAPVGPTAAATIVSEPQTSIVLGSYARTLTLVFGAPMGEMLRAGRHPQDFGYRVVRWLDEEWAFSLDPESPLFMIHKPTLLVLLDTVREGSKEAIQALTPEKFYFSELETAAQQSRGAVFRDGLAVRPRWEDLSDARELLWR